MRFRQLDPRYCGPGHWSALRWAVADRMLRPRLSAPAGPPAPAVSPDLSLIHSGDAVPRITWIGHASFLVQLAGQNLLIDPVFSDRIALFFRRHAAPGLKPDQLPAIDTLLLSHSHPDHLDLPSIDVVSRDASAVVPTGTGHVLTKRLFARVVELNWWESCTVRNLTITFVPARHWSRRTFGDLRRSLWGGFVIESADASLYFAGDSAWCDVFAEVGRRFPKLDAALMPIGGYEPQWYMSRFHVNPEDAGRAFVDCGARVLVPMHWGTFHIADEPLREPIERLEEWWRIHQPPGRSLERLAVGQTLCLPMQFETGSPTAPR